MGHNTEKSYVFVYKVNGSSEIETRNWEADLPPPHLAIWVENLPIDFCFGSEGHVNENKTCLCKFWTKTNPGSVPPPISFIVSPPPFFNVREMGKGNHISKLGKQTAVSFSERVPPVLFHLHPLIISSSPLELEGTRTRQFSPERWATSYPLR